MDPVIPTTIVFPASLVSMDEGWLGSPHPASSHLRSPGSAPIHPLAAVDGGLSGFARLRRDSPGPMAWVAAPPRRATHRHGVQVPFPGLSGP